MPLEIAYLARLVFYPTSYIVPPSFIVAPLFSVVFAALQVVFATPPCVIVAFPLKYVVVIQFSWSSAQSLRI